ncbi:MAG TPA: FKBP-type peptidyl-prolyl cis-trans isomerase [Spirochaetota bacterium]|nr:FKBP-type peptidyl-prolyl cis-trans isomerase [Spirochaetota bacterium]HSA16668.1 FKBP-type peptidyl-prolyl cis-trans isomerase [Spirochaetota bacterium]
MKTKLFSLFLGAAVALSIVSCKKADLSTDKGKYSYAIGYNIGSNIKKDQIDLDVNTFMAALEDALKGKENALSPQEVQQAMINLRMSMQAKMIKGAEENKAKGAAFLAANKSKQGVKTTASGLQYRVIKEGSGRRPNAANQVTVHYAGRLIDGTEFDSSYGRNQPAQFRLNQVIKGWTEGLQLMTAGSKYELVIPSELAYGPEGNQSIPGNSVLVFEVELISIDK